jgi:hypothetical protein
MPLTNRTHKALLDSLAGKSSAFGALASAPTLHVGLSTTAPAMAGTGVTEPAGGSYARVATAASDWSTATLADPSVLANGAIITFPQATGSWGTITHFAIYDAATAGNVVAYGTLTASRAIVSTDTARFAFGELAINLQSPA